MSTETAFTREELIRILNDFSVNVQLDTKMSRDALDKRLKQAIHLTQRGDIYLPKDSNALFDVQALPLWPGHFTFSKATGRSSTHERIEQEKAAREGRQWAPHGSSASHDLRYAVAAIAKAMDKGVMAFDVAERVNGHTHINIKIVNVYELGEKTPVLLVLYRIMASADCLFCAASSPRQGQVGLVKTTEFVIGLLIRILNSNARLLLKDDLERLRDLEDPQGSEEFSFSFLLPVGPLVGPDLGLLNADFGCAVCGERSSKRCSRCHSIRYCSSACQKSDWTQHKVTCKAVGGNWREFRFVRQRKPLKQPDGSLSFAPEDVSSMDGDLSVPPTNIHGREPFLVKLNLTTAGPPGRREIMVLDRQWSIFAMIHEQDCADARPFERLASRCHYSFTGERTYRWAKRTGDWLLSICLDQVPEREPGW